jgi:hypothetical protein
MREKWKKKRSRRLRRKRRKMRARSSAFPLSSSRPSFLDADAKCGRRVNVRPLSSARMHGGERSQPSARPTATSSSCSSCRRRPVPAFPTVHAAKDLLPVTRGVVASLPAWDAELRGCSSPTKVVVTCTVKCYCVLPAMSWPAALHARCGR